MDHLQVATLVTFRENSTSRPRNGQIVRPLPPYQIKLIIGCGRCCTLLLIQLGLHHARFRVLLRFDLLTKTRTLFLLEVAFVTVITLIAVSQLLGLFVALFIVEQEKLGRVSWPLGVITKH